MEARFLLMLTDSVIIDLVYSRTNSEIAFMLIKVRIRYELYTDKGRKSSIAIEDTKVFSVAGNENCH